MSESDEPKLDFSAVLMSSVHDIKNSLGMVLNSLDETAALEPDEDSPLTEQLKRLRYETKRVNNDLVQLLSLYKANNNNFSANRDYLDVDDFFDELQIEYRPLLTYNKIELTTECQAGLSWFFDRGLLAGVINNVLNNEVLYGRDQVVLSAAEEDGQLVVRIDDNGPGYPQQMLSRSEARMGETDMISGSTGLGLYFSMLVANAHQNGERKGTIKISNGGSLGGGCFAIYLP
ncbi:hypothetical protein BOW53_14465 [Solemya pervernicosa gill symbiont]|uniref:Histidine kinase domain-containing protein n=2 Tax=Gammaproteobacteria incertae sedis TaxID=118884 RepID=A0A1T2L0Y4_9GAMM|nr:HAMP domain-containing sensor histidine kinase [Candidatus Reidiella endopervernicosa]OOZ38724.1 hypothetical protein BOW53_14465 [Solemya pervernicosa gill symbiont]QKQ25835.1 HAMP domain-containing histidine kinase [Candidatus Reidiella endopervernicosa]